MITTTKTRKSNSVLGSDFGSNKIANLNQSILEQHQAKMEKKYQIIQKESEYDEDKIKTLFSSSVWTTEKVELYDTLKSNGDLEKYRIKHNPYYEGKMGLKREELIFHWTEDEVEEVNKCANDIIYFAKNYAKIRNEKGEYSLVTLRPFQEKMLETMAKERNIILFCSRQSGKTISTAMFMIWYMIFNSDKVLRVTSNTGVASKLLLQKVKVSDLIEIKQVGYYASNSVSLDTFTNNASKLILDLFNQDKIKVLFEANDGRYRSMLTSLERDKRFQRYIIVKTIHSETADKPKHKIGIRLNKQNRFMLFTTIREKIHEKKFIILDQDIPYHDTLFKHWKKNVETDPIKKAGRF